MQDAGLFQRCNRILVLDGGRIVEEGTYDALIQQGGFFADLAARQQLTPKQQTGN